MIPLKLQLKNFLSYGPELQTIDFEPYSLICLSGKNGHGKSALLDAITWALWGQARKISGAVKSDDALLRIGQTQMMVVFDFLCNGQTYRIRREYMKTYGKPVLAVDFGLFDKEKDSFIPLSDKTIRTTQEKIGQTLKLDFDSFINSAFLRQGQANEFSKKSPKERKDILGAILGLESYESIRKLAAEKARSATMEKSSLTGINEKIIQEIEASTIISQQIATVANQLNIINEQEQQLVIKKGHIEAHRAKLEEEKRKLQFLEFQLEQTKREATTEREALRKTRDEWKLVHNKQLHLPEQDNLEREKSKLIVAINDFQYRYQQTLESKEKRLNCQEQLQNLTQTLQKEAQIALHQQTMSIERLNVEQHHHEQLIAQLYSSTKDHQHALKEVLGDLTKLETEQHDVKISQEGFQAIIQQFEKRKEHYQRYITQGSLIQQELQNLEQKQKLSLDDCNPSCPLCEQNLSASRKKFLKQKFVKEGRFLKYRLNRLSKIVKNLKGLLINQHATIEKITKDREQKKIIQLHREELNKKKEEINKLVRTLQEKVSEEEQILEKTKKELTFFQNKLEEDKKSSIANLNSNPTLHMLKVQLDQYDQQLRDLCYQPELHAIAQKKLQQLEAQLSMYQHDLEQIMLQAKRQQCIHELCQSLRNRKKIIFDLEQKIAPLSNTEIRKLELITEERNISIQVTDLNKQKERLLQEKGRLEEQQNKRLQLEQEQLQYKKKIVSLAQTIEDYQTIANAVGKDGIQALLIQDIIPEIEQEANTILSKLTDNQAQIFIESLKDLKKGGTKETLDINISDSIGIRPYEMFSGGEAFRIDFALRIAISKLLARRAGTALQTLIIDEGFGSQDEEGLAHIMDAIYKIQEDFAKIIIVSHLSSMKELFPVHFFVEKGPQGSFVTTLEQG